MKVREYSDRFYRAHRCSTGRRDPEQIKLIVLHSTEGSTAEGAANTLSGESVSAHLVVGEGVTYRIVPEVEGACTVREPNAWTLNIEQVGYARWSRSEWLERIDTIRRSAYWAAHWTRKYSIPPRFRTAADLDAGKLRGYSTHAEVAASSLSSSTHTDPGKRYPLTGRIGFAALLRFYRLERRLFPARRPKRVGGE